MWSIRGPPPMYSIPTVRCCSRCKRLSTTNPRAVSLPAFRSTLEIRSPKLSNCLPAPDLGIVDNTARRRKPTSTIVARPATHQKKRRRTQHRQLCPPRDMVNEVVQTTCTAVQQLVNYMGVMGTAYEQNHSGAVCDSSGMCLLTKQRIPWAQLRRRAPEYFRTFFKSDKDFSASAAKRLMEVCPVATKPPARYVGECDRVVSLRGAPLNFARHIKWLSKP